MKRLLSACILGSVLSLVQLCQAQVTEQINFDNLPDGTLINTQYSSSGVTFDCGVLSYSSLTACLNANTTGNGGNVYARTPAISVVTYPCDHSWGSVTPSVAHSSNNVVSMFPLNSCPENQTFFNEQNGYLEATFSIPASSVSIWAYAVLPDQDNGTHQGATFNMPYLQAYDAKGTYLGVANYSSDAISTTLGWVELTVSSSMFSKNSLIAKVEFSSSFDGAGFPVWGEFDDLSFTLPSATVPPVVGMTLANAESSITAASLTVGTISQQPSSTAPLGDVISQSPAGGTIAVQGSAVSLSESCGAPATVPLVIGLLATVAESRIDAAGLTVGTATYVRNPAPLGNVISTSPSGSTGNLCPGSKVNVVISSGSNPPPPPRLP